MKKNTLFMETTKIGVGKTVAEIQTLLGESGCKGVMTMYEDGDVVSVCFQIRASGKDIAFKLPARWQSIHRNFMDRRNAGYRLVHKVDDDEIQAKRVAWRQILRWVQAQLALTNTNMVKIEEVFLPYIQVNVKGQTLFEKFENNNFKALTFKEAPDG